LRRIFKNNIQLSPLHITIISTLIIIAVLTFVALISLKLYKRVDLTIKKKYSLSEQTIKVFNSINKDISAVGFFTPDHQEREKIITLLKLFSDTTKHFTFEIVNPEINPGRSHKYGKILSGMVVVESGIHWEKINKPNETSILSAILRITSEEKRIVYFLQGHGEKELDNIENSGLLRVKNILESLGYDVKPVSFLKTNGVPDDADVVVVPGPEKDFFIEDLNDMNEYLEKGGALLILVDPNNLPNLEQFCRQFGINLGKGVVVDKSKRIPGSDFLVTLVEQYSNHEITAEIDSVSIFPLSRSVNVSGIKRKEINIIPLARTDEKSWLETDLVNLFNNGIPLFDELKDEKGPLTIAVAGELRNYQKEDQQYYGRLVIIGDSDFATNNYFDQGANADLFVNSVLWLNRQKNLIASRPSDQEFYPILLTESNSKLIFWLTVVIFPLIVLIAGVLVIKKVRWQS